MKTETWPGPEVATTIRPFAPMGVLKYCIGLAMATMSASANPGGPGVM